MGIEGPIVVVNFKAYREAVGRNSLSLVRSLERAQEDTGVTFAVCPNMVDISKVIDETSLIVLAQGGEPLSFGPYTGHVPIQVLAEVGVDGLLINHSENGIKFDDAVRLTEAANGLDMITVFCVPDAGGALTASTLSPTAIAVEPPELIGGPVSVSRARPDLLVEVVASLQGSYGGLILAGAGVSSAEDAERASELGMDGVLVSSAIVASPDPYKKAVDIATGLLKGWRR